jgi:pyruvate dehydrogenase E2 component (dihydrolipoyllysine-residue acetyltransferase)
MGALVDIKVPDIGDFTDVEVVEVMVKPGDRVDAEDSLITIESDKASMEVPSPHAGVIKEVKVKVGDKVSEGSPIVVLEEAAASQAEGASAPAERKPRPAPKLVEAPRPERQAPAPAPQRPERRQPAPAESTPLQPAPAQPSATVIQLTAAVQSSGPRPHASPAVRKFARELGVDLSRVSGSGMHGRIFRADVQKFVKAAMAGGSTAARAGVQLDLAPWPRVDFTKYGEVATVPLSRIRRASKSNLARNWAMIPHVTQFDEADVTELEAMRRELNADPANADARVTILSFVLKALVAVLKQFPEFNSSLDGDNLILKKYFHFGFAADTPDGLVVPVIRDVDRKGVVEIARETARLAAAAREGKLAPLQIQGGCITVSSLGGIGGTAFTPIINAPEVAILGLSRIARKPVWREGAFVPRLILPLSLAYDHRVIDGAVAARFITYLSSILADMRRALL